MSGRIAGGLVRLLWRLELLLTGHWIYCGGCGRFSPRPYCDCGDRDAEEEYGRE